MRSHFLRATYRVILNCIANTSSNTATITYPTGIIEGDLIVWVVTAGNSGSATPPTITAPAGYTLITSQTAYNTSASDADNTHIYYKIAAGTETGSTTYTATGTVKRSTMLVFRKSKGINTVTVGGLTKQGSAGTQVTLTTQTVTASAGTAPLIVFAYYGNAGTTRTFTPDANEEVILSTTSNYISYKTYASNPQNHSVSMVNAFAENTLISFYLQVT